MLRSSPMRTVCLTALPLALAACASTSSGPSAAQVQRELRYSVVFGFTTDDQGKLADLRVAGVYELGPNRKIDIRPSAAFVESARRAFLNGRWTPRRNADGTPKEAFQFCYWSAAVPDQAICAEEFREPR